jgi:Carboxypeptidase regulatory-like domain
VTDSSGKPLPDVKISVRNVATGETTATETDSAGQYNLTILAGEERNSGEGRYDVGPAVTEGLRLGEFSARPCEVRERFLLFLKPTRFSVGVFRASIPIIGSAG